jgi:glycine hydroxymethyltransferase
LILAKANPELEKKLNSAVFPGSQGGPLEHVIAAKAVAFKEAMLPEFTSYQFQIVKNARIMVEEMMKRDYKIVSGGTDNHLFLVDLVNKNLSGKEAELALAKANITTNKNAVPADPRPPMVTSGLRMGASAVTTRGFKEAECGTIAGWICDILDDSQNEATISRVQREVLTLCRRFPVYEKK